MTGGGSGRRRDTRPLPGGPGGSVPRRGTPIALRVLGTDYEIPLPTEIERFAIGSDPSNHLVLDDETVSSVHCVLERRGPHRLVLKDRRSTNGTFVNGVRVTESMVEPGARIVLGHTSLSLVGRDLKGQAAVLELLVGEAPSFKSAIDVALRAARTSETVLMHGESGTGKELFARLVHEASPRAEGPFVPVNCAAIAASLVESELFGHEKGAFTGAGTRRLGVFEQADGGTLFLDEVGELPLRQQPKLLRVLETRRVNRLGGAGEHPIDVRVIAATHRDLRSMTDLGDFRLDLFHRIAGIELRIPSLRERPGDVAMLVRRFLDELAPQLGQRKIDSETMQSLLAYTWPGNVRELRQAVHRAAAMCEQYLELRHLLPEGPARRAVAAGTIPPIPGLGAGDPMGGRGGSLLPDNIKIDDLMRHVLAKALARHGSQRRAAQALGMSRSTFNEKVHRYGLVQRRKREGGDGRAHAGTGLSTHASDDDGEGDGG